MSLVVLGVFIFGCWKCLGAVYDVVCLAGVVVSQLMCCCVGWVDRCSVLSWFEDKK